MDGVTQELLSGIVVDGTGVRRSIQLSCSVFPSLGRNPFLVKQAARNGIMSILDMDDPRREAALDARTSKLVQTQADRRSRRSEVERRRERDQGAEHGVTGGGDDEGGPQEREYRSGQRRDKERQTSQFSKIMFEFISHCIY